MPGRREPTKSPTPIGEPMNLPDKNLEQLPDEITLEELRETANRHSPESKESYLSSLHRALEALRGTEGIAELEPTPRPTIIIPDLHGRKDFILHLLETKVLMPPEMKEEKTVYDLLKEGWVNIVFLGDGMHLETPDIMGTYDDETVQEWDVVASLNTMKMIMELVASFKGRAVYLRGNHDFSADPLTLFKKSGNHCVQQGEIFSRNVRKIFGEDFSKEYINWEKALPLLVKGKNFVASHAAPGRILTEQEIRNRTESAFYNLTWVDNVHHDLSEGDETKDGDEGNEWFKMSKNRGTNERCLEGTRSNIGAEKHAWWFIGHRQTDPYELVRKQFGGRLVQINSPFAEACILVNAQNTSYVPLNMKDLNIYLPSSLSAAGVDL
ncbi:MAG: hypothetical protein WC752_02155 [Patescibacteria group bacterium]|jgi:hypothetical protein